MGSNEGRVEGSKSDAAFHAPMQPEQHRIPEEQIERYRMILRGKGFTADQIATIYPPTKP